MPLPLIYVKYTPMFFKNKVTRAHTFKTEGEQTSFLDRMKKLYADLEVL